jgi:hypothetical protein
LGEAYARFDAVMRNEEFLAIVGRITNIANLLYGPGYVGGGTHENLGGQELDSHVDFNYHPRTPWHWRVNPTLFLNPEWEASWGGCLELLADPFAPEDAVRQVVVPVANRAVIFETAESSWLGFRRMRLPVGKKASRRSIGVSFYTKERAAEETAPSHATIYYQRPQPAHIGAGHTLSGEDRGEIETLLARRDGTIRFLYQREHARAQPSPDRSRSGWGGR